LHIVDLDGAAAGELCNLDIVREIARAVLVPTQLGGGIRNLETIETLLRAGIERVILGTAAVENPNLVVKACQRFQESIIVGIDAREGVVATHGWLQDSEQTAVALAENMAQLGVRRFIYTDISRDGTLTEPNFSAIAEMIDAIKSIAQKIKSDEITVDDIDEVLVEQHLYTDGIPDPDIIIRTSGEERLSGFLTWQSVYSELYFTDVFFPGFRKIDLWRAIRVFQQRNRRYGR